MQFDATAAELGGLLKTKFHEYTHGPTQDKHVACDEYYVPHHVAEHVDYITPGIRLLAPPHKTRAQGDKEKRTPKGDVEKRAPGLPPITLPLPAPLTTLLALPLEELCGIAITPDCLFALYNITKPSSKAVAGNELGIFEDLGVSLPETVFERLLTCVAGSLQR